jgi:hypothetical protein
MLENKLTVPLEQPPANNRQHRTTPTSNHANIKSSGTFSGLVRWSHQSAACNGRPLFHSITFGSVPTVPKQNLFSITTILFELRCDLGRNFDFTIVAKISSHRVRCSFGFYHSGHAHLKTECFRGVATLP